MLILIRVLANVIFGKGFDYKIYGRWHHLWNRCKY